MLRLLGFWGWCIMYGGGCLRSWLFRLFRGDVKKKFELDVCFDMLI